MFRKLRLAVLVYVLLLVAAARYLTVMSTTDWNETLWVDLYVVGPEGNADVQAYIESLDGQSFAAVERFFSAEAARYGVGLTRPFRIEWAGQIATGLPTLPTELSLPGTILWSLRVRWFATRLHWRSERPTPDVTLFVVYHAVAEAAVLDRSTALRKGMIAIANVFADRAMAGANQLIAAHELLHTLGASDKYDPVTGVPRFPAGYADPDRKPRWPQSRAEIMGGRIPVSADSAVIPPDLDSVIIGPATADEIGWGNQSPPLLSAFAP